MTISLRKLIVRVAILVLLGLWALSYFFYVDLKNSCVIALKPGLMSLTEFNHGNIKEGIRVLKRAEPQVYESLCNNIGSIASNIGCGGWQGGCHYGNEGEITLSTTRSEFVAWTAAIISHELCHDIQLREGRAFSEDECYQFDHEILQSVVDVYP